MIGLAFVLLIISLCDCHGHSTFVSMCSQPMHMRSLAWKVKPIVSARIDGTQITISSDSKFRGFLFYGTGGLTFTTAPEHGEVSGICNEVPNGSVSHTSPYERDTLVLNFDCEPGSQVSIQGYVVYKYDKPFVKTGGDFTCPDHVSIASDESPESSRSAPSLVP